MPSPKSILCYGDSNTWGYDASTGERHPRDTRWTGVLQHTLGADYHVNEAGLNGRTTCFDDPFSPHLNGKTLLAPTLLTHAPLDLVILMLGTNDVKTRFNVSALEIAIGMERLLTIIKQTFLGGDVPQILMMCPPPVIEFEAYHDTQATQYEHGIHVFAGAHAKGLQLPARYAAVAQQQGCHFLDVGEVVSTSLSDGIHWDADQHIKFGKHLAQVVQGIL